MSKKMEPIKPLPGGVSPTYGVTGVTPEQEEAIRAHVSDFAPNAYPDQIAVLPGEQYRKVADQIARTGMFGNTRIGRGEGAQESWGPGGSTHIGNGFSMRSTGRMYLNGDLLSRPKDLRETLEHEFGHYSAPATDNSEDTAEKWRTGTYGPRAKAQEALTSQVANAPAQRPAYVAPLPEPLPPVEGRISTPEDAYKMKAPFTR